MKTGVLICPGRGTYNATEIGYLQRARLDKVVLDEFEDIRKERGQLSLTSLDSAESYDPALHATGDNASALIYACTVADTLALRDIEIVAVTGNSMGWYSALACANALSWSDGFRLVCSMGELMHQEAEGGQLVYPWMDNEWHVEPGRKADLVSTIRAIDAQRGCCLSISIDLGGMLVLAGNEAGLEAFEKTVPKVDGRFPIRLKHHAAFHSSLMSAISDKALASSFGETWRQPDKPLIDGRGHIWWPESCDLDALRHYTLGHQVTQTYDFSSAIRTAAREFAPDVFVVPGPGTTLGGPVAQSLVLADWLKLNNKSRFHVHQKSQETLRILGNRNSAKS